MKEFRVVSFALGSMHSSTLELLDELGREVEGKSLACVVSDDRPSSRKAGRDEGSLQDWMMQEGSPASEAASLKSSET